MPNGNCQIERPPIPLIRLALPAALWYNPPVRYEASRLCETESERRAMDREPKGADSLRSD